MSDASEKHLLTITTNNGSSTEVMKEPSGLSTLPVAVPTWLQRVTGHYSHPHLAEHGGISVASPSPPKTLQAQNSSHHGRPGVDPTGPSGDDRHCEGGGRHGGPMRIQVTGSSPLKTLSQGGSGSNTNNRSAVGLGGIEFDIVPSPSEAFDAGFTFGGGSGGVHRGSISIRRGSEVTITTGKSSSPQRRAVTLRLDGNDQTVVTSRGADESNDTNLTDRLSRAVGGTSKDFPVATKASLDQLKRVVGSDKEEGDDVFTMDDHNLVEDTSSAATANNSDNQMSLAQKLFHNSWFFRGDNAGLSQEEVEAKEKQITPVEKKLREMEKMKTLNLQMPLNL